MNGNCPLSQVSAFTPCSLRAHPWPWDMLFWDKWLKPSVLQNLIWLFEREPYLLTSFILLFNKSRSEKLGDLPKDAQPNRYKIQAVIWVSWLLILSYYSDIPKQNYYSSSIYLGPAIILETTLPTFIYSFDKHLLHIFYVPGTIREENEVMNKPGFYFQGAYIMVWRDNHRALSSQNLAPREKIALRMFSGYK